MKKTFYSALTTLIFLAPTVAFSQASSLEGKWYTTKPEKNAVIEITKCTPEGKTYCGTMVALQTPNYPDGTPKIDKNNKDETLRTRPLLGLKLLDGFVQDDDTSWSEGKIYNPEDGDLYSCEMNLESEEGKEVLHVRGYVGVPLFGKTQEWIRLKDGEKAPWSQH